MRATDEGEQPVVLVEFAPAPGLQRVALTPADVAERSREVLDSAMATIREMAHRICATIDGINQQPAEVQVKFGLKLEASAGAFIAKTSGEASINVTMTWRPGKTDHAR